MCKNSLSSQVISLLPKLRRCSSAFLDEPYKNSCVVCMPIYFPSGLCVSILVLAECLHNFFFILCFSGFQITTRSKLIILSIILLPLFFDIKDERGD